MTTTASPSENPEDKKPHELSNAIATMTGRKFRIPGDVVNKATANLEDDQRSLVRWLHAYAAEHDLHLAELAAKIRYDESTLHRVFNGKYDGKLENVCREIAAFKKLAEARGSITKLSFIETAMSRQIWKLCDTALTYQKIGFLFGDSQTGKTTALMSYARLHNHGQTIYVRMPTGGVLGLLLSEFAQALRMSPQQKEKELRRRVIQAFDDRMLLIVDEAHQVFVTNEGNSRIRSLEFLREIHDRSGCGLIICGTNTARDEIMSGRHSKLLQQLERRALFTRQLPNQATRRDLDMIAAAYGLESAHGEGETLQAETIRESGLGKWCTFLQAASRIASKQGKKLAWAHVIAAHAGIKALEKL